MSEIIEIPEEYTREVSEVRALLGRFFDAGVDLFMKLRSIEERGTWKLGGHRDFTEYLSKEFPNALGFGRYRNVIRAIGVYGEDWVRHHGIDAAIVATKDVIINDDDRRNSLLAKVSEHMHMHGVPPDADKMRKLVFDTVPEARPPSPEARSIRARLEALQEVERLRLEVKALRKRIHDLESELENLQDRDGQKSGLRKGVKGDRQTAA